MPEKSSERPTVTAVRLFQERGFALVDIDAIVRAADIARMSHFRSREGLALAANEALSQARQDTIDVAINVAFDLPDLRLQVGSFGDLVRSVAP